MLTTTLPRRSYVRPVAGLILGALFSLALSGSLLPRPAHAQATPPLMWGYVMNYAGQFVPDATVTLYTLPAHSAAGTVATSDALGRWHMTPGSGTFAVRATAPGYDFAEQTVYATAAQTGITFILRQLGAGAPVPLVATMSGRVTSLDGVPLGGMNIVAQNQVDTGVRQVQQPPTLSATVTDADGTFTLPVPAGPVWLTLKSGAMWGYQRKPVEVQAGETLTNADFVAAVRVLDRSNFPLATPTAAPATPISNVGPLLGGMPATGTGGTPLLWLALVALGVVAVGAGGVLVRQARPQR